MPKTTINIADADSHNYIGRSRTGGHEHIAVVGDLIQLPGHYEMHVGGNTDLVEVLSRCWIYHEDRVVLYVGHPNRARILEMTAAVSTPGEARNEWYRFQA